MHLRTIAAALTALAAAAILAVPAFAKTFQVNVTQGNSTCTFALTSVHRPNTAIVFHLINNGTVTHGLLIWGVQSAMIPARSAGNLEVDFHKPGTYHYACLAGSYKHPTVVKRGVFKIVS
jgi:pyruvate/2-oxoacid:ferredoxin oxidoreductase alpha subunit